MLGIRRFMRLACLIWRRIPEWIAWGRGTVGMLWMSSDSHLVREGFVVHEFKYGEEALMSKSILSTYCVPKALTRSQAPGNPKSK